MPDTPSAVPPPQSPHPAFSPEAQQLIPILKPVLEAFAAELAQQMSQQAAPAISRGVAQNIQAMLPQLLQHIQQAGLNGNQAVHRVTGHDENGNPAAYDVNLPQLLFTLGESIEELNDSICMAANIKDYEDEDEDEEPEPVRPRKRKR